MLMDCMFVMCPWSCASMTNATPFVTRNRHVTSHYRRPSADAEHVTHLQPCLLHNITSTPCCALCVPIHQVSDHSDLVLRILKHHVHCRTPPLDARLQGTPPRRGTSCDNSNSLTEDHKLTEPAAHADRSSCRCICLSYSRQCYDLVRFTTTRPARDTWAPHVAQYSSSQALNTRMSVHWGEFC